MMLVKKWALCLWALVCLGVGCVAWFWLGNVHVSPPHNLSPPQAVASKKIDSHGYMIDVEYEKSFIEPQAPILLSYATTFHKNESLNLSQPFSYLDLGCGQGTTVNMLAMIYPHADFWGVDLMPEHVKNAKSFSQKHGVKNTHFIQSDFQHLELGKLPKFDIIVLHGVWTWVTDDVKKDILRIVKNNLKPGGMVYVGYNILPGWAKYSALGELLRYFYKKQDGDALHKLDGVLSIVKDLQEAGSAFIKQDRRVEAKIDSITSRNGALYVVHEYLNEGSVPVYSKDLYKQMSDLGLQYVGSSNPVCNKPDAYLSSAQSKILKKFSRPDEKMTLHDYLIHIVFRRDIYQNPSLSKRFFKYKPDFFFFSPIHPTYLPTSYNRYGFIYEITKKPYSDIILFCQNYPRTFGEIHAFLRKSSKEEDVLNAILLMLADKVLVLTHTRPNKDSPPLDKKLVVSSSIPSSLLEDGLVSRQAVSLPCSATGMPIMASFEDVLFLLALRETKGERVGVWLLKFLEKRGLIQRIFQDGQFVTEQSLENAYISWTKTYLVRYWNLGIVMLEKNRA